MAADCPVPVCELLEWDSCFFGFRIGRARVDSLTSRTVEEIASWCHQNRVRCLYFLARADDPITTRLAEHNDFRLVDIRMSLECYLPAFSPTVGLPSAEDVTLGPVSGAGESSSADSNSDAQSAIGQLRQIARESYRDTRFYYDDGFPRERVDKLYETWIQRSCEGWADTVLVAEQAGAPVGYISCRLEEENSGSIGLVGVSSRARGEGVGKMLVLGALDWFERRDVQQVTVVTQGRNCAAQRLYQRCGFITRSMQLWYHRWYEG